MSTPLGPAGWHPDPTGRYEYRYFNGQQWTADVSVHGQRFVDQVGPAVWQQGWGPAMPTGPQRKRGMAVAALVVGLAALALSWIPFVFVLGGVAAVVAIGLGSIGLRAAGRQDGYGRNQALWGMFLAVLALGMCVVGFLFTRLVMREVDAYLDPGPYAKGITQCSMSSETGLAMRGFITNQDVRDRSYEVTVEYAFSDDSAASEVITVAGVPAGTSQEFSTHLTVVKQAGVQCEISAVYGPAPFRAISGG